MVTVAVSASTVDYVQETGTSYQTPAIGAYDTYGNMMSGMNVWVTFSDGSVEHAIWGSTGSSSGAATAGGYFTISESGDTFDNNAWTLQNLSRTLSITSFTLLGAPGDTTFDRTFGGGVGTLNSAYGKDFNINGSYCVTATYSDILNLKGAAPVGDEFVQLSVAFATNSCFRPDASTTFTQDTDNAAVHGTIIINNVPDGASTALLMGLGLTVLVVFRRRVV
jgi:hypothetical protein